MAKKTKTKKSSKSKNDNKKSKSKQLSKEEINDLKKNLLVKTESSISKKEKQKQKEIKSVKKKEKEKEKEIKKEKKEEKIIINKIKEEKKHIEENKEKNKKINKIQNGGLVQNNKLKKNKSHSNEKLGQTLLELMKNKENVTEVTLNDDHYSNKNKNNSKKGQKKYSIDNKSEEIKPKNEAEDKNEYIKKVKAKIVMVNGRMVIEKPDVGLINKKYNEEHYKNISPIETVFVNNEEKVINSLSFLNKKPTKKWTEEENKLFYKAIEMFGLDFSFLEIVLKKRTREEIKRKYLKEKKENFENIEKAINARKDVGKLKQILDLYKGEKGQNYLGLFKEESFRTRRNNSTKNEKVDYDKEYKNILNKD